MTERIDLDDVDVESGDEDGNEGDWLWRDDEDVEADDERFGGDDERIEGSPESTREAASSADASTDSASPADGASSTDSESSTDSSASDDESGSEPTNESGTELTGDSQGDRTPHVPYESADSPAGIPAEHGGAGGGAGPAEDRAEAPAASGPHGGGVDEMATAYTYEAVQRLADPHVALAATNEFSDWVGLVGDVPAHAINAFLREHQLDIDFFNGSGDGPAERLADIDEHSMFYAERMVVVGTDGEEWIADDADWEFVPLADAAEKADWELSA